MENIIGVLINLLACVKRQIAYTANTDSPILTRNSSIVARTSKTVALAIRDANSDLGLK